MNSRAYIAAVARRMGVPDMWIEDAVADIELQLWRSGRTSKTAVRQAAIDAARRYGWHNRYGRSRLQTVDIAEAYHVSDPEDDFAEVDARLSPIPSRFLEAWRMLTPRNQGILLRSVEGHPDVSHQRVHQIRTKLRRLLVA